MIRSFFYALICSLALTLPATAADFFTSENYWDGKKAYDKGDYAGAMKHWRESADLGEGEAQYFVGAMYHSGQAGEKDYAKAKEWYMKAAVQDVDLAQMGLGGMYGDGEGVEKDYVMARMWFSIADINGNERAGQYVKKLDTLMTPEQIASSEKMAVDWINKIKMKN